MTPILELLWQCEPLQSTEHFSLHSTRRGHLLQGVVVLPIDGAPANIHYLVEVDGSWRTAHMKADIASRATRRQIVADVTGNEWRINDDVTSTLSGCIDVDLGWTPATNTLPIKRLGLATGETAKIEVGWLRFPELIFERSVQTYTRLSASRWRYKSGDFERVLEVTAEGVVTRYGEDLWRAVSISR